MLSTMWDYVRWKLISNTLDLISENFHLISVFCYSILTMSLFIYFCFFVFFVGILAFDSLVLYWIDWMLQIVKEKKHKRKSTFFWFSLFHYVQGKNVSSSTWTFDAFLLSLSRITFVYFAKHDRFEYE